MGRNVKELKRGKHKIDKAKVQQEEKLDGKYLLSTSDQNLSAEDIAPGYKQLLEVKRAFRTLKGTLCLQSVYLSDIFWKDTFVDLPLSNRRACCKMA